MSIRLRDAAVERDGWREREFELELEEERAAGVLWTPLHDARPGIVLLGHGFTTDCRCHSLVPAARRLAGRHGLTAASLDMPVHGTRWRGAADASFEERHRAWTAQWRAGGYERIPRAATDALFEGLGSEEKRLLSSPGGHEAVPPAVYEEAVDLLARHLGAP